MKGGSETVSEPKLQRATPVLRSGDYIRSRTFYTDILGFKVMEEGGDPPRFGIFRRDGAVLFVDSWQGPPADSAAGWVAYIHVDDVVALRAQLVERGVEGPTEVRVTTYGMREFELRDPDGNLLCFGVDAS